MVSRIVTGEVVRSGKMKKTVTLKIDRYFAHKRYGKRIKKTVFWHAHDENQVANIGELWSIQESPKISKMKNWVLLEKKV